MHGRDSATSARALPQPRRQRLLHVPRRVSRSPCKSKGPLAMRPAVYCREHIRPRGDEKTSMVTAADRRGHGPLRETRTTVYAIRPAIPLDSPRRYSGAFRPAAAPSRWLAAGGGELSDVSFQPSARSDVRNSSFNGHWPISNWQFPLNPSLTSDLSPVPHAHQRTPRKVSRLL